MPTMPCSSPIRDDHAVSFLGTGIQKMSSLREGTQRSMLSPHTCASPAVKRSWENGMRISAVQPSESIVAFPSHTGSKRPSMSYSWSRGWYQSMRVPAAVIPNEYAVRRSR
jgi:hypothetical protein